MNCSWSETTPLSMTRLTTAALGMRLSVEIRRFSSNLWPQLKFVSFEICRFSWNSSLQLQFVASVEIRLLSWNSSFLNGLGTRLYSRILNLVPRSPPPLLRNANMLGKPGIFSHVNMWLEKSQNFQNRKARFAHCYPTISHLLPSLYLLFWVLFTLLPFAYLPSALHAIVHKAC